MSQINEGAGGEKAPTWLPETARRIILAGGSTGGDWSGVAAVEVADLVARHRPRTLLVNTVGGSGGPDGVLGIEGQPGLGEVVAGQRRVGDVAAMPPGRSFIFVPAGQTPPAIEHLCAAPAFRHLVAAAGRGGTLLLYATEADLGPVFRETAASEGLKFDGLVLLGDASGPIDLPPGVKLLARVETEAPKHPPHPDLREGGMAGFSRPGGTPSIVAGRKAKRPLRGLDKLLAAFGRRGVGPAGGVATVWLAAVAAVWLLWQGLSGWPAFEDDFESPTQSTVTNGAPVVGGADASNADESAVAGGDATDPVSPAEGAGDRRTAADSAIAPGVELPYSILVASYVTYEDAAFKRDELAGLGSLAFVAPTPIRGRLYYRVFAGASEDRVQASDLMRRLVESGGKERERDWDMRPVRLAFALGDFSSVEEAEAERQRLHDSGLPAYVLPVGDTTGAIYRLYSGAFESEGAAGPTDTLLSAAGQNAALVTRRGEPR